MEEEDFEEVHDCEEAAGLTNSVAMDECMTPISLVSVPQATPQATVPSVLEDMSPSTDSTLALTITAGGKRMPHQLLMVRQFCSSFLSSILHFPS